ncbi:MAG: holotricin-3 [Raoultibacter sp.]
MLEDDKPIKPWRRQRESYELLEDPHPKKWYRQTFWIIVMLIVFWPVGLVLAWKSDWILPAKLASVVFVLFCVAMVLHMQATVAALG